MVAATTRNPDREGLFRANGANEVFIDNGPISEEVRKKHLNGFSKILELGGVTALEDTMKCAKDQGIVCITGIAEESECLKMSALTLSFQHRFV